MKRTFISLAVLVLVYFAVNFRWTHAALVYTVHAQRCDASIIEQAAERIDGLFGTTTSQPLIGCLPNPIWGQGHIIGTTNFAPGLPATILLNRDGAQSLDVIAHEWAHAEIAQRTSVIHRTYTMPTWFDEGLAMQVDQREAYSERAMNELAFEPDVSRPRSLAAIATISTFFQPSKTGRYHYALARCVINDWRQANPGWQARFGETAYEAKYFVTHYDQCISSNAD